MSISESGPSRHEKAERSDALAIALYKHAKRVQRNYISFAARAAIWREGCNNNGAHGQRPTHRPHAERFVVAQKA